jgi:hypothetical protein
LELFYRLLYSAARLIHGQYPKGRRIWWCAFGRGKAQIGNNALAADTNGSYSLVQIVSDLVRAGTPLHIYQNEDEHFIILEGTARIASGRKAHLARKNHTVGESTSVLRARKLLNRLSASI